MGCGLFDQEKYKGVPGIFCAVPGSFCLPFSLFVTFSYFFFTARKLCKLLFIGERGKICYVFVTFFTTYNLDKLLFTVDKGQGL
jgi:hypothetical protein